MNSQARLEKHAADLLSALQSVRRALEEGFLIADPIRFRTDPGMLIEFIRLNNEINLAIFKATGEANEISK